MEQTLRQKKCERLEEGGSEVLEAAWEVGDVTESMGSLQESRLRWGGGDSCGEACTYILC